MSKEKQMPNYPKREVDIMCLYDECEALRRRNKELSDRWDEQHFLVSEFEFKLHEAEKKLEIAVEGLKNIEWMYQSKGGHAFKMAKGTLLQIRGEKNGT